MGALLALQFLETAARDGAAALALLSFAETALAPSELAAFRAVVDTQTAAARRCNTES